MTKEELTALGLTDEQADKVFVLHGKGVEKYKTAAEAADQKIVDLNSQLRQRDKDLADLKKLDAAGLQQKLTDLQTQYDTDRQDWEAKEQRRAYEDRRREFFEGISFADEYARRGVLAEFDECGFEYSDKDKGFRGAKDWLEQLMQSSPATFKTAKPSLEAVRKTNGGTQTIKPEDFAKMTYMQKFKLKAEQPDLFKTLKAGSAEPTGGTE